MCAARKVTPPSCPIYDIHLTEDEIKRIVNLSLKNVTSITSEVFPSGSSYNNRIYALEVTHGDHINKSRLILKINGWPIDWKHFKVQNEVLSLSLVNKYCPEIPIPRVVAWCDGTLTAIQDGENVGKQFAPLTEKEWILMSRLPGRSISESDLSTMEQDILRDQVAAAFAALRKNIPIARSIGNTRLNDSLLHQSNLLDKLSVGKLFNFPDANGAPWSSLLDYYRAILAHEIMLAEKYHEVMKPNVSLIENVKSFISDKLPSLQIFKDSDLPLNAFTHGDFSDRNLLYLREPQKNAVIFSGWVDWEFAGYYNPYEEFLMLEDEEDFVGRTPFSSRKEVQDRRVRPPLDAFYKILQDEGVDTPLQDTNRLNPLSLHWDTARYLYQIQCNIIPWFVRVKWDAGEKDSLADEVEKAGRKLSMALQWFENGCFEEKAG